MPGPGWRDFDQSVVRAIRVGNAAAIDREGTGGKGLRCPLVGHDHWLPWDDRGYKYGTKPHDDPQLRFRASGTYILDDPLENFVSGRDLVGEALSGAWPKAETWRLGNENSEDAVSWNVFRGLQEAHALKEVAEHLCDARFEGDPQLITWGRRIEPTTTLPAPEIKAALELLEPAHSQQTEPDVVLRVPGEAWIFIEAKLASATSTYRNKHERVTEWIHRYGQIPNVFEQAELQATDASVFPEQLLRNVAVAATVRKRGERAFVLALVREQALTSTAGWEGNMLHPAAPITAGVATWEQIYTSLPRVSELDTLRKYMEDKSVNLHQAFAV
jgi:hypothetical protein